MNKPLTEIILESQTEVYKEMILHYYDLTFGGDKNPLLTREKAGEMFDKWVEDLRESGRQEVLKEDES